MYQYLARFCQILVQLKRNVIKLLRGYCDSQAKWPVAVLHLQSLPHLT